MFYVFKWTNPGPIHVQFVASKKFEFQLRDTATGKIIKKATVVGKVPLSQGKSGDELFRWDLYVSSLSVGPHVLQITGPPKSSFGLFYETAKK